MKKKFTILLVLSIIFLVSMIVSIALGNINISFLEIIGIFNADNEVVKKVILDIRLPRVLNSAIIGFALSASGIILQSLLRNNLAEPGLLGISAGAGFGAIIIFVFGISTAFWMVTPFAFATAILTTMLIFVIARGMNSKYSNFISSNKIILAGLAINAFLGSLNGFLLLRSGENVKQILYWLNGSLSGRGWEEFNIILIPVIIALIFSMLISKELNVMNMGEEFAVSLGVNLKRMQTVSITLASVLAACAVAVAGIITFVGLIVPNIAKLLIGSDNRFTVPCTILLGGIFMVVSDTLARLVIAPSEIPVGVVTSFIGAPIFVWLIYKRDKQKI